MSALISAYAMSLTSVAALTALGCVVVGSIVWCVLLAVQVLRERRRAKSTINDIDGCNTNNNA